MEITYDIEHGRLSTVSGVECSVILDPIDNCVYTFKGTGGLPERAFYKQAAAVAVSNDVDGASLESVLKDHEDAIFEIFKAYRDNDPDARLLVEQLEYIISTEVNSHWDAEDYLLGNGRISAALDVYRRLNKGQTIEQIVEDYIIDADINANALLDSSDVEQVVRELIEQHVYCAQCDDVDDIEVGHEHG
jgi:hypothetical protein